MYKRILLTLDGSTLSERALPYAVAQAEQFDAELILLKVIGPVGDKLKIYTDTIRQLEDDTRYFYEQYLTGIATDLMAQGIQVRTVTLTGSPHQKIIEFAEQEDVDLVVICTRGVSGFSRWLMGGVADRVIRGIRKPLLVVHPNKEEQ